MKELVRVQLKIELDEEEMELYSDIFNRLSFNKKPREIIEKLHSYDCINHQMKMILAAINGVVKEMSVIEFIVLSQNVERALVLSVMEGIK